MEATLEDAPREDTAAAVEDPLVVSLPAPDGSMQRFALQESSVMEAGLAAKHPDIKTYAGRGIDDPTARIRTDLTPAGFHASVLQPRGAWYIDPTYRQARASTRATTRATSARRKRRSRSGRTLLRHVKTTDGRIGWLLLLSTVPAALVGAPSTTRSRSSTTRSG